MKHPSPGLEVVLLVLTLVLAFAARGHAAGGGSGAPAGVKKPLSYDAYDGWRTIQGTALSRDGQWLVYALVPQDGDGELVVRNLKTDKEFRAARGRQPVVTVGRQVRRLHGRPGESRRGQGQEGQEETGGAAQERPRRHGPGDGPGDDGRAGQELQGAGGIGRLRRLSPRAAAQEAGREEGRSEEGGGEARGQTRGQARAREGSAEARRAEERGEEEGARHRSRRPRPRLGQGDEDRRSGRLRLEQAGHLARIRDLFQDARRTTAPSPSRRRRERPSPCSKASATTRT